MSSKPSNVRILSVLGLAALTAFGPLACASLSRKEKGAIVGAAAGGTVGAVIGKHQGSTAKGAIIGAVLGGAAGAIIGHQMDQQAKEIQQNIPGAKVERVGEGIQVTFASGATLRLRLRRDTRRRQNEPAYAGRKPRQVSGHGSADCRPYGQRRERHLQPGSLPASLRFRGQVPRERGSGEHAHHYSGAGGD